MKKIAFPSVTLFCVVFLTIPTLIVIATSFTSSDAIRFPPEGFSLQWYAELLEASSIRRAFGRSLYVALICTLIAIPVGTLAALAMVKYRIKYLGAIRLYLLLPFTMPLVVSGICLLILYGHMNILDQLWPVGVALCIINLPFMIWAVAASANALDADVEYAAASLGAPPVQTFLFVTVPAVIPGVVTGSLLMFVLAMNEFVVSLLLVSKRTMTLPVEVFLSIRSSVTPDLAALATIYVLVSVIAIIVLDRLIGLETFLKSKV
ncbi:MAG: ABC transporter permease [Hyphomicrobiales bacterium]|nr:ABC transporter permease [Hyphomicrobiales bacterium]